MRVRLIKRKSIEGFAVQNAGSRASFRLWLTFLKMADWSGPGDILETFGSADSLGNGSDRVVFDIAGNNYRMICKYHFGVTRIHLYIKWIGTHAEYTKLCHANRQICREQLLKQITMQALQYKIIKTGAQYNKYCDILEALVCTTRKAKAIHDEIELLTLLIEKYDAGQNTFKDADPIELLKALMKDHKMKAVDLADLLKVSQGLVSDILHYKKGLSKETIRILSERFKLNQEAFNRPYQLHMPVNPGYKGAKMMTPRKKLAKAS